jgi:hypothetical protein
VPSNYAVTNGDILTTSIAVMAGTRAVIIGGNFSSVTTPDGRVHAATHFAILDLLNPNRVIYAARGVNSYVRESVAYAGVVYAAGDFTTFGGQSRNRLVAIDASTLAIRSWNPGSARRVEALAAADNAIFFGGADSSIKAVRPARATNPGQVVWQKPVGGGPVRVMIVNPARTALYVGGLFEKVGTKTQHGLVKVRVSDGVNYDSFAPIFRPDSGIGEKGSWDGDCILALANDATTGKLLVGSGGARRNMIAYISGATGSGTNAAWAVPPSSGAIRNSEGDVQAVAVAGDVIAMGYHRGHVNYNTVWPTKRNLTLWNSRDGAIQTWDAGLWGTAPNDDGGNGGVQAMTYDPGSKKLVVGGAFKGYGDPYNNTGGSDIYGAGGPRRQSLAIFNVQ